MTPLEQYRRWWASRPWHERMFRYALWYAWGQFVFGAWAMFTPVLCWRCREETKP
jgi:hypothetical protein